MTVSYFVLAISYFVLAVAFFGCVTPAASSTSSSRTCESDGSGSCATPSLGSGAMFDQIAPFYDVANKFMSLSLDTSWRRALVNDLQLPAFFVANGRGAKKLDILDIATGTGDVAIMIAQDLTRLGVAPQASIVGMDPSARMLSYADTKLNAKNYSSLIQLKQGSAEVLDDLTLSNTRKYDKVTISFGIRNFANKDKALRAIHAALKDDKTSQVSIIEFVTPRSGPLAPLAKLFLVNVVPWLGTLAAGKAHEEEYNHLRDSILNFPTPEEFVLSMSAAGLKGCIYKNVFLHVVVLFSCSASNVSS